MKLLLIIAAFALAGCDRTIPRREFPKLPPNLVTRCPDLQLLPDGTTKLSEMLTVTSANYSQYYQCQALVDSWNKWYTEQKHTFDNVEK